ncbi:aminodeoxychorismate synthase, component I [Ahniella affigens]|uniref:Aminodeoxychorismate synthase, component I n=1 Tax=Ahniella affigens TaxID=2021234 RepID=A0A2P1PP99_9GAMM|nr:aminodeoxychorismate synthase component I [Ahniella affigens]AVP96667.1 aminodeoxychorismate synthase, component I [Ahniella affigens]
MRVRTLPQHWDLQRLHAADPVRFPMLLESRARHARSGRFDLLLATTGDALIQTARAAVVDQHGQFQGEDLLRVLQERLPSAPSAAPESLAELGHFAGGYALLLGYEYAACLEPRLHDVLAEPELPRALALRTPLAFVRDHALDRLSAVYEPEAEAWVEALLAGLAPESLLVPPDTLIIESLHEDPALQFCAGVDTIRDYIAAGDVFQVNLSRQWQAEVSGPNPAASLYRRLREANPAPFAGSLVYRDWAVLSSSPERLVAVRGDLIETRPIAGTRPRAQGDADLALQAELLAHPKERAEHIMLIDLERNDLGRVAVAGSVQVDELMTIETYTHVHHIVSNVRARLRADASLRDIIAAVFPGGTITGCPKIRCMEIIAELEACPRGFYTGAMGFVGPGRQMELNILIRTMSLSGNDVRLRAGAGIVYDSVPERELAETRHKARGLLQALGMTA